MQRCIDECSAAKYLLWVFSSLQNHVHVLTHYCCFFACSLSNARFQFALDLGYMCNKSFFISSEFHSEHVQVNTFFFFLESDFFNFFSLGHCFLECFWFKAASLTGCGVTAKGFLPSMPFVLHKSFFPALFQETLLLCVTPQSRLSFSICDVNHSIFSLKTFLSRTCSPTARPL